MSAAISCRGGRALPNLITRYSDSPYARAHFRIGENPLPGRPRTLRGGLIRYQLKYRSGARSNSLFMIAHSFFKTGRSADAKSGFAKLKKVADLSGLPGTTD